MAATQLRNDPTVITPPRWSDRLRRHKWRTGLLAALLALAFIAVVPPLRNAAALLSSRIILLVTSPFAPSVKVLETAPTAAKVTAADGSVLGAATKEGTATPVHIQDLPLHVRQAVLAAEDADFYEHSGVNPSSVIRASLNMATGSRTQGGSTITQQLAKLNYTTGERTIFRKLREVLFASRLEKDYSKDQLLERYLNQVFFGDRAYGIEAAAQRTYGVPAAKLRVDQAAAIAVRIRSPAGLDPRTHSDLVLPRRNAVLAIMASRGWIQREQLAALQATPLDPIPLAPDVATSEAQTLARARAEVRGLRVLGATQEDRDARLATGGLTLETAIDPAGQKAADETARKLLDRPDDPSAAVVSVKPGDGAITVLVGDSRGGGFDAATVGRRQPGSSFKPFTYIAAIEKGIRPDTTLFDSRSPITLSYGGQPFTVKNAEPGTGKPMSLEDATVESVNTVYAQLVLQVGPKAVVDVARRFGEPDDLDALPSIALGGLRNGVSPLDQAAAYATLATKGTYAAPYLVARIKDASGKVVWTHEKATRRAVDETIAGVVNTTLQRVVAEGTGKGAAIGRPVAGKTGTTNDSVDAWFVGYTPDLATAVWVGHIEGSQPALDHRGKPMYGGAVPAQVFAATMKAALAKVPPRKLPVNSMDDLGIEAPKDATTLAPTTLPAVPGETTTTVAVLPEDTVPTTTPEETPTTLLPRPTTTRPTCTPSTTAPPGATTTTSSSTTTTTRKDRGTTTTTLPPCP